MVGEEEGAVATGILDYWLERTIAQKGVRADPEHPRMASSPGYSSWALEKATTVTTMHGSCWAPSPSPLCRARIAGMRPSLKCLLANLRTTGRYGFRNDRIDIEPA